MFLLYRLQLEKLFELCPLMQTVMPHENDVGGFSLLIPSPQKYLTYTSFLPYQKCPDIRGYFNTPIYFTLKDDVTDFHIRNASNSQHSVSLKRT